MKNWKLNSQVRGVGFGAFLGNNVSTVLVKFEPYFRSLLIILHINGDDKHFQYRNQA